MCMDSPALEKRLTFHRNCRWFGLSARVVCVCVCVCVCVKLSHGGEAEQPPW